MCKIECPHGSSYSKLQEVCHTCLKFVLPLRILKVLKSWFIIFNRCQGFFVFITLSIIHIWWNDICIVLWPYLGNRIYENLWHKKGVKHIKKKRRKSCFSALKRLRDGSHIMFRPESLWTQMQRRRTISTYCVQITKQFSSSSCLWDLSSVWLIKVEELHL